jgi:hypothetical protein
MRAYRRECIGPQLREARRVPAQPFEDIRPDRPRLGLTRDVVRDENKPPPLFQGRVDRLPERLETPAVGGKA